MKSLLSANLAVRAMKDGRVALIDWDAQGSLSIWWKLRGQPSNPMLYAAKGNDFNRAVAALKAEGYQTIIIDTPPSLMDPIREAIEAVDFVVVPTRVGLFDIAGIRPVIGFCKDLGRPFLFVLTGTNPDATGWPKLIRDAAASLKKFGTVAAKTIRERAVYITALNNGKAATEVESREGKAAAAEINALWQAIKKQATQR